jgi:excinuclease ABC subunit A
LLGSKGLKDVYSRLGDKGGEIVVAGTPEEKAEHPTSHTGRYLKQVLAQHPPELGSV